MSSGNTSAQSTASYRSWTSCSCLLSRSILVLAGCQVTLATVNLQGSVLGLSHGNIVYACTIWSVSIPASTAAFLPRSLTGTAEVGPVGRTHKDGKRMFHNPQNALAILWVLRQPSLLNLAVFSTLSILWFEYEGLSLTCVFELMIPREWHCVGGPASRSGSLGEDLESYLSRYR